MAIAYKLFVLSLLLKSFILFFGYGHNAKCTNQDSNCVYARTFLWNKRWYDDTKMRILRRYSMYATEGVSMITIVHK